MLPDVPQPDGRLRPASGEYPRQAKARELLGPAETLWLISNSLRAERILDPIVNASA